MDIPTNPIVWHLFDSSCQDDSNERSQHRDWLRNNEVLSKLLEIYLHTRGPMIEEKIRDFTRDKNFARVFSDGYAGCNPILTLQWYTWMCLVYARPNILAFLWIKRTNFTKTNCTLATDERYTEDFYLSNIKVKYTLCHDKSHLCIIRTCQLKKDKSLRRNMVSVCVPKFDQSPKFDHPLLDTLQF